MLDPSLPRPSAGRTYGSRRRVRLSDMDASGRIRLDAVARFLQDVAIDDVQETGWGTPEHLWFVRRIRLEVRKPLLRDRELELVTWCSGVAAIAAGRRWTVTGDAGGLVEVDSVWIHLGPDQRPARIESFGIYTEATGGRAVTTRLELAPPGAEAVRHPWPLRATDVDLHGHVNNAVYWHAVEEALRLRGLDVRAPLVAELDYRDPIDNGDELELAIDATDGGVVVGFCVGTSTRAVARVSGAGGGLRTGR